MPFLEVEPTSSGDGSHGEKVPLASPYQPHSPRKLNCGVIGTQTQPKMEENGGKWALGDPYASPTGPMQAPMRVWSMANRVEPGQRPPVRRSGSVCGHFGTFWADLIHFWLCSRSPPPPPVDPPRIQGVEIEPEPSVQMIHLSDVRLPVARRY